MLRRSFSSAATEEQAISPGLPNPMARSDCHRRPARNGTDPAQPCCSRKSPNKPAAGSRPTSAVAWSCAPASRSARSSSAKPGAKNSARRPGCRGGRGRRPGRPAQPPAHAHPLPASCPATGPRRPGRRGRRERPDHGLATRPPARARPLPAGSAADRPQCAACRGGHGRPDRGAALGGPALRPSRTSISCQDSPPGGVSLANRSGGSSCCADGRPGRPGCRG